MDLIASTADLAAACSRLAKHPFVTVDTEFMRETTYYPKLCLIQMAVPDEGVLVDPLAPGIDLRPFVPQLLLVSAWKRVHARADDVEVGSGGSSTERCRNCAALIEPPWRVLDHGARRRDRNPRHARPAAAKASIALAEARRRDDDRRSRLIGRESRQSGQPAKPSGPPSART
jgi:3'-5' exonuclease